MELSRLLRRLLPRRDPDAPRRLPSPDEPVLVARPNGEPEAQFMRDVLDQHDIRSMVRNRDALTVQAGGIGPSWAYEVWVMRRDAHRAREVLGLTSEE